MNHTLVQTVKILPGGLLQLRSPFLEDYVDHEVMVTIDEIKAPSETDNDIFAFLDALPRDCPRSMADAINQLREDRDSWDDRET